MYRPGSEGLELLCEWCRRRYCRPRGVADGVAVPWAPLLKPHCDEHCRRRACRMLANEPGLSLPGITPNDPLCDGGEIDVAPAAAMVWKKGKEIWSARIWAAVKFGQACERKRAAMSQ